MWLLIASIRDAIENAQASGLVPTPEQLTLTEANYTAAMAGEGSRIMAVAGNTAEIQIHGVMTNRPSFFARFFGGGNTTYPEIITAVAQAESDPNVDNIVLDIDSGGGQHEGLFDAMAAVQMAKKPVRAVISNVGASAAFGLATQAGEVFASNRAARIGSVGVAVEMRIDPNTLTLSSEKAPKKRPDLTTPEGKAIVQEELNAMHDLFVESIADGRGTTVKKVNANFGQGGTLLADEALSQGMIDGILGQSSNPNTPTAAAGGTIQESKKMDEIELQAKYPAVHAAVMQRGVDNERERAACHLTMGESSGDMKTALTAVENGDPMTELYRCKYAAHKMKQDDSKARIADDSEAEAADGAAPAASAADEKATLEEDTISFVEAEMGVSADV